MDPWTQEQILTKLERIAQALEDAVQRVDSPGGFANGWRDGIQGEPPKDIVPPYAMDTRDAYAANYSRGYQDARKCLQLHANPPKAATGCIDCGFERCCLACRSEVTDGPE